MSWGTVTWAPPGSVTVVDFPDDVAVGVVLPPAVPSPPVVPAPVPVTVVPPGFAVKPEPVPVVLPLGVRDEVDFGESLVPDPLLTGDDEVPAAGPFGAGRLAFDVACAGFVGPTG